MFHPGGPSVPTEANHPFVYSDFVCGDRFREPSCHLAQSFDTLGPTGVGDYEFYSKESYGHLFLLEKVCNSDTIVNFL